MLLFRRTSWSRGGWRSAAAAVAGTGSYHVYSPGVFSYLLYPPAGLRSRSRSRHEVAVPAPAPQPCFSTIGDRQHAGGFWWKYSIVDSGDLNVKGAGTEGEGVEVGAPPPGSFTNVGLFQGTAGLGLPATDGADQRVDSAGLRQVPGGGVRTPHACGPACTRDGA